MGQSRIFNSVHWGNIIEKVVLPFQDFVDGTYFYAIKSNSIDFLFPSNERHQNRVFYPFSCDFFEKYIFDTFYSRNIKDYTEILNFVI